MRCQQTVTTRADVNGVFWHYLACCCCLLSSLLLLLFLLLFSCGVTNSLSFIVLIIVLMRSTNNAPFIELSSIVLVRRCRERETNTPTITSVTDPLHSGKTYRHSSQQVHPGGLRKQLLLGGRWRWSGLFIVAPYLSRCVPVWAGVDRVAVWGSTKTIKAEPKPWEGRGSYEQTPHSLIPDHSSSTRGWLSQGRSLTGSTRQYSAGQ